MPLAGLVVNRAISDRRRRCPPHAAMAGVERLRTSGDDHGLAAGLLRLHADRVAHRSREAADAAGSAPAIPTCRRRWCRRCRPTCTTWTACAGSASCWPPRWTTDQPADPSSDGLSVSRRSAQSTLARRLVSCSAPSRAARARRSRSAAGEAAHGAHARSCRPRRPTRSVVQGLGQAFGSHGARTAHRLGLVLLAPRTKSSSGAPCWHSRHRPTSHSRTCSLQRSGPGHFTARPDTSVFNPREIRREVSRFETDPTVVNLV